jgi:hypothetical protein
MAEVDSMGRDFSLMRTGFIGTARQSPVMDEENMDGTPVRKVIQISSMVHPVKDWAFIALCDDGSLWLYHGSWSRIENIPQTACDSGEEKNR